MPTPETINALIELLDKCEAAMQAASADFANPDLGIVCHNLALRCNLMIKELKQADAPVPVAEVKAIELFAWLGEDELGSGVIGLKQAHVPAGFIPLVATSREKVMGSMIPVQMQLQSNVYNKVIRLCRFVFAEELIALQPNRRGLETPADKNPPA